MVGAPDAQAALRLGVTLYAEGRYWDAHEAWEGPWRVERDPERRRFLQGLILAAAAMHKLLGMANPVRAALLLARALEKLAPYADDHEGLALDAFRREARACEQAIAALDVPFDAGRFDRTQVPRLTFRARVT